MNTLTKTLLTTLVLGMSSTIAFAEESAADTAGRNPPPPTTNNDCGPCEGIIKVSLQVPKTCELKVNTSNIALGQIGTTNNWAGTGTFAVTANADYKLSIVAPTNLKRNGTGASLPVSVTTLLGSATVTPTSTYTYQSAPRTFTVDAKSNNLNASSYQEGSYTGTYTVGVLF